MANPRAMPHASMYRVVYAEIEEVGWEHLLYLEKDLSSLCFRVLDEKERRHDLLIELPQNYPEGLPSITADVPYLFNLSWMANSRLKDVVQQFKEHLQKLQAFWSTLESIDKSLVIINPKRPSLASSYRQICLGDGCSLLLCINARNPATLPECRFLGPEVATEIILKKWKRNGRKWSNDRPFIENLSLLLETKLHGPPKDCGVEDNQIECGICYAQYLPLVDDLGNNSRTTPDYTCNNPCCSRAFHTICLRDWLCSITTTRQSFDVLFGNCPYCLDVVAVTTNCTS